MELVGELSRVLGVVKGRETYDAWATCFRETWQELNDLKALGKVMVAVDHDGEPDVYEIRFYLGKQLLMWPN